MTLLFALAAAAIAAVKAMDLASVHEPELAYGVTGTIKVGIVRAIVSGIGSVISAMLGIRSTTSLFARRRMVSYGDDE